MYRNYRYIYEVYDHSLMLHLLAQYNHTQTHILMIVCARVSRCFQLHSDFLCWVKREKIERMPQQRQRMFALANDDI